MSDIQKANGAVATTQRAIPAPIAMLPAELQKSVRWFCGFYFETLKGTAAVASRFRWWMEEEGLTLEEAKAAMREMMKPEKSADIDTAPKVVAVLSREVARILRDRREKERTDRVTRLEDPASEEIVKMKKILEERMAPKPKPTQVMPV